MANTNTDMFAPPTPEELRASAPAPVSRVSPSSDLFAPPTQAELNTALKADVPPSVAQSPVDMFAPPTKAELLSTQKSVSPVDKEIENRSALDKPLLVPEEIKQTDLDQIAAKHGVSAEDLRAAIPYFAGLPENAKLADYVHGALGFAGASAGLGIPQKLYKMAQDPKQEAALDDLQDLIQGRRSYAQVGAELFTPIVGAVSTGGNLAKGIAVGAGIGAGGGFGYSHAGEEVKSAAIGAGAGAVLGAAGEKLAGWLGRKATPAEEQLLKGPRTRQIDLDAITSEAAEKYKNSEAILENTTFDKLDPAGINRQEGEAILKDTYGDSLKDFLNAETPEGEAMRRSLGSNASEQDIYTQLIDKAIDTRAKDFAEEISGRRPSTYEDAVKLIKDQENRQGQEYVASRYKDYAEQQMVSRYTDETGTRAYGSATNRPIEKLSASQYVLQHYDDVYGTKLGEGLSELSRDTNRSTAIKGVFRQGLDDIYQTAAKAGRDDSLINGAPIIRAIETGTTNLLDDADRDLAQKVSKQFADIRDFANEQVTHVEGNRVKPLAIPEVENYVSRTPVDMPEMVAKVTTTMDRLKQDLSEQLGRQIDDLSQVTKQDLAKFRDNNKDFKNLVDFISWKDSELYVPKSGAEMSGLLKESLYTQDGNVGLERAARAAMARSEETPVPTFIREHNVYKLMDSYSNDILSTLYKRRGIDMLRKEADKLDTVGASSEASYVNKLIQDTLGTRKGTAAAVMNSIKREIATSLESKIQNASNPVTKGALELVKSVPDIISYCGNQIYSSVMGFNLHSILQTTAAGFVRTAPEMGGAYGQYTYLRGLLNATLNPKQLIADARRLGFEPAEYTRQGEQALMQGIMRNNIVRAPVAAYEGVAKFSMALFKTAMEMHRASSLGAAQMMTADLMRGSDMARKSLQNFPFSVQKQVQLAGNDSQRVYEIIGKHLNDRTVFNYDRQSMFELGRELGPLFTTFSKWPTEMAGEAIYDLRSKGILKGGGTMTKRLLTPVLALSALDYAVQESGMAGDRYHKIAGAHGLRSIAPVTALTEFAAGGVFTPPAVDAVMHGVIHPLMAGQGVKVERGAETLAYNYLPGVGLLTRMVRDLSTYITGSKPEGAGQTEKTADALRKLSR